MTGGWNYISVVFMKHILLSPMVWLALMTLGAWAGFAAWAYFFIIR